MKKQTKFTCPLYIGKGIFLYILLLTLAGCQPMPAQLDAHATKVAGEIYATLTAEAQSVTGSAEDVSEDVTGDVTEDVVAAETPEPPVEKEALTPAQIFEQVSPAVAFIETDVATGSGLLITGPDDALYILTNAHVIWPYNMARVVLPDGTEFVDLPLLGADQLLDLAVLGPVESDVEPLPLGDGEVSAIGSDVYLIGYPGEADKFPEPTIAGGIISRVREWEAGQLTYFQTDAAIAGGQSGGVLVSVNGDVIGISGLGFSEVFALAASTADIAPQIARLIDEDDTERSMVELATDGKNSLAFRLETLWSENMYLLQLEAGEDIQIRAESDDDIALTLNDLDGNQLFYVDDSLEGEELIEESIEDAGFYFLVIEQFSEELITGELESSHPLSFYDDPDDSQPSLEIGSSLAGYMDYPDDIDVFTIELSEGEIIEVYADSIGIDPLLAISNPNDSDQALLTDDDTGGGIFGTNSILIYQAPRDGLHQITVESDLSTEVGGYYLTVREAAPDAMPAIIESLDDDDYDYSDDYEVEAEVIETEFGEMMLYVSDEYPFSIQYPSEWTEQYPEEGMTAQFVNQSAGGMLVLAEEDLIALGFGQFSLEDYSDLVETVLQGQMEDIKLDKITEKTTAQGEPALIMEYTALNGIMRLARFVYMSDDYVAFNATIFGPRAVFEEIGEMADYIFDSFEVLSDE